jgi:hypothetical protein
MPHHSCSAYWGHINARAEAIKAEVDEQRMAGMITTMAEEDVRGCRCISKNILLLTQAGAGRIGARKPRGGTTSAGPGYFCAADTPQIDGGSAW